MARPATPDLLTAMTALPSGDDLAFAPALDQAQALRAGELGAVELTELYLRRIERLDTGADDGLSAYLTVAADQALDAARAAQRRLDEGRGDDALPPFLGVPISIKDLHDTAGIRTTHGTATWNARIPQRDDEVVARIRRAGFVVLGKTNTPEFGSRSTTESPAYPTARNPWDRTRTPGGSSGGAGAALAAGLCPIALGSDGGGSVRIPAAWCGLVGLKPSRGRVTWAPGPQSWNATTGPLARTVADAAALLDVMAGPAPGDAWWAPPPARPFRAEVGSPPGRLRVAWTTAHPDPTAAVEPAWRDAVLAAAAALESEGHELVEAAPPAMDLASSALIPASALASADRPATRRHPRPAEPHPRAVREQRDRDRARRRHAPAAVRVASCRRVLRAVRCAPHSDARRGPARDRGADHG